jgi:hypothetical protein
MIVTKNFVFAAKVADGFTVRILDVELNDTVAGMTAPVATRVTRTVAEL